jgi:predicted lipoprotein with Yx(FWY)xxD motif
MGRGDMTKRGRASRQRRGRTAGRWAGWVVGGALAVGTALMATLVAPGAAGAASSATVITTTHNKTWGTILVLGNGDTVYRLSADRHDKSVCTGVCATIWPPVTLAKSQRSPIGRGVARLGVITRPGGARQVTFDGEPLYRFSGDTRPGQTNGNNLKDTWGRWWVIDPAHPGSVPVRVTSAPKKTSAHKKTTAPKKTSAHKKTTAPKKTTTTHHSSGGGYNY